MEQVSDALTLKNVERLLVESFAGSFTPESAKAFLGLRASEAEQARVSELAAKSSQGELSPEEAAEYNAYVLFGTRIAILQAKARQYLMSLGEK